MPREHEISELEFFYWELTGFLVVRNALSPAQLAAANAVVDKHLPSVDFASAAEQRIYQHLPLKNDRS